MLNQIKDKIQAIDFKVRIGGLIGLAAIAGLIYLQYKKPYVTPKRQINASGNLKAGSKNTESEVGENQSPEKNLIRVINSIKRTYTGGKIEYDTIKAIYNGQYDLSLKEFRALALKHRSDRRKAVKDINRYREISNQYEENLQSLHEKHLNAILAHFRIDKTGWMELVDEANASREDWPNVLNEAENQEICSLRLKDKPRLGLQTLINIYKFKAKKLQENSQFYSSIPDIEETDLCSLVEKLLQDMVYEQYKVEEEDIKFSEKMLSRVETEELEKHQENLLDLIRNLIFKAEDGDSSGYISGGRDDS